MEQNNKTATKKIFDPLLIQNNPLFINIYDLKSKINKCYYHAYLLKMQSDDPDFVKPPRDPIFHQKLFNKPSLVLSQSQKSKKQLQDFIYAFQKRIDAEISYAKNLLGVSKYLDKHILPGTQKSASYVCSAFKVNNQQRAQQANELAESFKTQIVSIATQMLNQHGNKIQKFKRDYKRLSKQLSSYEQNLTRTESNYKAMDKETQQLLIKKNIVKYSNELSQDKKSKHISKTLQTLREKKEYQTAYLQAGKQYNEFIRSFKQNISSMLQQSDKDQQARIRIQADSIRKMIVCQISMFKNVEYDLINISKQMEVIKPQIDIEKFVQQCQDKETQIKSSLDQKNLDVDNSLLAISLKKIEEQYFTWLINFKKNKNLRSIITSRWKTLNQNNVNSVISDQSQPRSSIQVTLQQKVQAPEQDKLKQQTNKSSEIVDTAKSQQQTQSKKKQNIPQNLTPSKYILYYSQEELKKFWHQVAEKEKVFDQPYLKVQTEISSPAVKTPQQLFNQFIKVTQIIAYFWKGGYKKDMLKQFETTISNNQNMRLLCNFFIQQYRTHHIVSTQTKSVKPISKLLNTFLEEARKADDAFTVRNLIGLIFIFCYQEANNKKNFYQHALVYQAAIWKRNDFWDAAIFESIYQQLALFTVQSSQTHSETILREKNMIFSQLASYCHYMIMMGISSKNVRLIVGKYCRLLDMTDDQNKDLSKMITNTYKQFKEMFGAGMIG